MSAKRWNPRQRDLMTDVYNWKKRINVIDRVIGKMERKLVNYYKEKDWMKDSIKDRMDLVLAEESLYLKRSSMRAKYSKYYECDDNGVKERVAKILAEKPIKLSSVYKSFHIKAKDIKLGELEVKDE